MTKSTPATNPAEAYEQVIAQGIFAVWTDDLLARSAPRPGEDVLDLACGTGMVTRRLVQMVHPGGSVVGLDISPPMLEVAKTRVPTDAASVELREGSGTEMPLEDERFDLVVCQQGLQFFPDHAQGLREIRRVLRPGGRAVVSVWRGLEEQPLLAALDDVVSRHLAPGSLAPGLALADADELRDLTLEAGLHDVGVEQATMPIQIDEPVAFVSMMLQGAAAVLPAFSTLTQDERDSLSERMNEDLRRAIQPLTDEDGRLLHRTSANVLSARR